MSTTPLRPSPVPETRPPVQTRPPADLSPRARRGRVAAVQQTLMLLPGERAWTAASRDDFGPVPTPRADLPDPHAFSRGLVQVLVEVMAGLRPCTQLLRWTTTGTFEQVRLLTLPPQRSGQPPTGRRRRPVVRSIRVCEPTDGVAEVSAVVTGPLRTQAVALRCEGQDGRWRVTALETG